MKRSFEELEKQADKPIDPQATFTDPRVAELWAMAVKANLSDAELTSFRVCLRFKQYFSIVFKLY